MDLRRLRAGEWIAGVSGAVLLVALFLPWYGEDDVSRSGWESFAVFDLALALVALAALAIPFVTAAHRVPAVPLAHESLTVLVGTVASLLVLFRVLNLPDWADGREAGLWLGFAAVLGVTVGALAAIRDERRSPAGRHTDLSGAPLARAREIETHPAPRPEGGVAERGGGVAGPEARS